MCASRVGFFIIISVTLGGIASCAEGKDAALSSFPSMICGDGIVGPGEACDNGVLNSDTYPDACRTNCQRATCGDGVIDTLEACDGLAMPSATCDAFSPLFDGGKLTCHLSCRPDQSACSTCGDARCEPPAENANTCATDCSPDILATGARHSCLAKVDGTVWCWGDNQSGQLGNGTRISRWHPVQVLGIGGEGRLTGVVDLTAGAGHTCALHGDGMMTCWGSNSAGQLGNPRQSYSLTPMHVDAPTGKAFLTQVAALAAGDAHTCAIRSNGAAYCWGAGRRGQLGNRRFASSGRPVLVEALREDNGAPAAVKAITAGADHTCAMRGDGAVFCWGQAALGQLGSGHWTDQNEPVQVRHAQHREPMRDMVSIQAGDHFTCALGPVGNVFCWGANQAGQLGDGLVTHWRCGSTAVPADCSPFAVQVAGVKGTGHIGAMTSIAAGGENACAVTAKGSAYCWGSNLLGKLGDGRYTHEPCGLPGETFDCSRSPVHVVTTGKSDPKRAVSTVAVGGLHLCALTTKDQTLCWGGALAGALGDARETGQLCSGPVFDYPCRAKPALVFEAGSEGRVDSAIQVVAGWAHACALARNGTIWCWGRGESGQLGDGKATHQACDYLTDCSVDALRVVGTHRVNYFSRATDITAGDSHTCAIRTDGSAWCWGVNNRGQLGDGTTTKRTAPVRVTAEGEGRVLNQATRIKAGLSHTCALRREGELVCFGSNIFGQLGDGTLTDRPEAAAVMDPILGGAMTQVRDFAAGAAHTCAVMNTGTIFCWGINDLGQLGDGSRESSTTPVQVLGPAGAGTFSDAAAVVAGWSHTCALTKKGTVWCWGEKALGNSDTFLTMAEACRGRPCTLTPIQVRGSLTGRPLSDIAQLSAAKHHTCATNRAGTVYCWGKDSYGQLGHGAQAIGVTQGDPAQLHPVVASNGYGHLRDIVGVAAGGSGFSCGLTGAGDIHCWGRGTEGQLGEGYQHNRLTPAKAATRQPSTYFTFSRVAHSGQAMADF